MPHIAYYISSHGFGHAARQQAIIKQLAAQGIQVHVRTNAPQKFFRTAASYHQQYYDIGMFQSDALTIDVAASLQWYANFLAEQEPIIAQEVAFIHEHDIQLVVSDMPPVAMDIAAAAAVPSVAVTNFTWDWVYSYYLDDFPQYQWMVEAIRESYLKATLALQMPFAHEFDMFTQVEPIPLVINRPTQSTLETRKQLQIPQSFKLALLSMGGHAWGKSDIRALKQMEGWIFLVMPGAWEQVKDSPNFRLIATDYDDYHNLIAAADVVVGKAGGSTTAEVIGHRTPMIYTTLPNWREAALLDAALREYGVGIYVDAHAFQSGEWIRRLRGILHRPHRWPPIATNGAQVAVERLLHLL